MTTVMDLSNALAGAVERVSGWMFAVHGRPRVPSTGVQWRTGLVVTANHTVEHDREVTLTGHDGRSFAASVAGRDPSLDIAVLRAVVDGVSAADVADDGDVRVGHLVMALGAGPRASAGIVSALDVGRGRHAAGDLLAIVMASSFAIATVIIRRHPEIQMAPAAVLATTLTFLVALPLAAPLETAPRDLALLAFFGVGQFGVGFLLFMAGARLLRAAQSSLIGMLEIVLGPLWVWLVLSERPPTASLTGGALILVALLTNTVLDVATPRRANMTS